MYRLSRIARASAALTLVGLVAASTARAAVSAPVWMSGIELDATRFALAMNPSGDRSALLYGGTVTGSRSGRTMLYAKLGHGRSFSSGQRLEDLRRGTGARAQVRLNAVRISVAPDGGAVAAWVVLTGTRSFDDQRYRLRIARARAGERFGRSLTALSATQPLELSDVVAGRDGLAVVALQRGQRAQVLVGRRGGRLTAPQDLGPSTTYVAPPSLALATGGTVIAAWSPSIGSTAQAALLAPRAGRFQAPRTVSAAGEPASYAGAVAGPGGAGVAWTTSSTQSLPTAVSARMRIARLNAGAAGFAAPVTLAEGAISGVGQVALPRAGAASTWRRYVDKTEPGDSDYFVDSQLIAHAPLAGDTAPRALSQLPAIAFRPVIGALGDRALILWREAPVVRTGSRLRLAVAAPGRWAPTVIVADGGVNVQTTPETGIVDDEYPSGDPAIATGRHRALLVWNALARDERGRTVHRVRLASYRP